MSKQTLTERVAGLEGDVSGIWSKLGKDITELKVQVKGIEGRRHVASERLDEQTDRLNKLQERINRQEQELGRELAGRIAAIEKWVGDVNVASKAALELNQRDKTMKTPPTPAWGSSLADRNLQVPTSPIVTTPPLAPQLALGRQPVKPGPDVRVPLAIGFYALGFVSAVFLGLLGGVL